MENEKLLDSKQILSFTLHDTMNMCNFITINEYCFALLSFILNDVILELINILH